MVASANAATVPEWISSQVFDKHMNKEKVNSERSKILWWFPHIVVSLCHFQPCAFLINVSFPESQWSYILKHI
jgi:hypothetical protein